MLLSFDPQGHHTYSLYSTVITSPVSQCLNEINYKHHNKKVTHQLGDICYLLSFSDFKSLCDCDAQNSGIKNKCLLGVSRFEMIGSVTAQQEGAESPKL